VFKTMLSTELVISKPFLKEKDAPNADASAVIGFSGDASGSVVLSFPMATAVKSASTFSGTQITPEHEDFADALGELANMVAGQAKAQFDGLNISTSLPSVIVGQKHTVSKSQHQPTLVLPCDSALGRFSVEAAMIVDKPVSVRATAPAAAVK